MPLVTIGVVSEDMHDATSFYRAYGPLGALLRNHNIRVQPLENFSWAILKHIDILMMHRPFAPKHVQIAELARINKKPLWIDYDDDLLSVPYNNPTYITYSKQAVKDSIKQLLYVADIVTVSTTGLLESYSKIADPGKIKLIHNAFDDDIFAYPSGTIPEKIILWRGTSTHFDDLMEVQDGYKELIRDLTDWEFHFWGFNPTYITKDWAEDPRIKFFPACDIIMYHYRLQNTKPSILVVPLVDGVFNRAKSNCAWLEGIWAGAVTVAPNWPEWRNGGTVVYDNPSDFAKTVKSVVGFNQDQLLGLYKQGLDEMIKHRVLSVVNKKRVKLIESLVYPRLIT